jgi:hypothetical protein
MPKKNPDESLPANTAHNIEDKALFFGGSGFVSFLITRKRSALCFDERLDFS